jgi:hypothetical protein
MSKNQQGNVIAGFDSDATSPGAECRTVWGRHVRAAVAGDIDAVMSDFTDHSAIITADSVLAGTSAIRGFFEKLLGGLDQQAHQSTVMNAEMVHGDTLVANFTIGSIGRTFHDTAVIREGKFAVLSTVNYPTG